MNDKLRKQIKLHSPYVSSLINYHGHEMLKLLVADNSLIQQSLNAQDVDYRFFQNRMSFCKKNADKIESLMKFIANKSEILLTEREIPKLDYEDKEYTDRYNCQYPFEYFMKVPFEERRDAFNKFVKEGNLLIVMVQGYNQFVYTLKILCFDAGPHRYVLDMKPSDLKIVMFPEDTDVEKSDSGGSSNWLLGTRLRVRVLQVEDTVIRVGTKGENCELPLGKITISEMPLIFSTFPNPKIKTLSQCMEKMKSFNNPQCIKHYANQMNIDLNSYSSLLNCFRENFPEEECATALRKSQMCKWAHKSVADGVARFKSGAHEEAFQCLHKALQIDPENVEAFVAKGALMANLGYYEKAIEDFEQALKYNSTHHNAKKYMCETLVELGKQYTDNNKTDKAEEVYKKCLQLNEKHTGCREAYDKLLRKLNEKAIAEKEEELYKAFLQMEKEYNMNKKEAEREVKKDPLSPLARKLASTEEVNLWANQPELLKFEAHDASEKNDKALYSLPELSKSVNVSGENQVLSEKKKEIKTTKVKLDKKSSIDSSRRIKKRRSYSRSSSSSFCSTCSSSSSDSSRRKRKKKAKKRKKETKRSDEKKKSSKNAAEISLDFEDLEKKLEAYYQKTASINDKSNSVKSPSKTSVTEPSKKELFGEKTTVAEPPKKELFWEKQKATKVTTSSQNIKRHPIFIDSDEESNIDEGLKKSVKKEGNIDKLMHETNKFLVNSKDIESHKRSHSRSKSRNIDYSRRSRSRSKPKRIKRDSRSRSREYDHRRNRRYRSKSRERVHQRSNRSWSPYRDRQRYRSQKYRSPDRPKSFSKPSKKDLVNDAKLKIEKHLSANFPSSKALTSSSHRFGKWNEASDAPNLDKNSKVPETLDQFEDFLKKGKEKKLEEMKKRNEKFLKPTD